MLHMTLENLLKILEGTIEMHRHIGIVRVPKERKPLNVIVVEMGEQHVVLTGGRIAPGLRGTETNDPTPRIKYYLPLIIKLKLYTGGIPSTGSKQPPRQ